MENKKENIKIDRERSHCMKHFVFDDISDIVNSLYYDVNSMGGDLEDIRANVKNIIWNISNYIIKNDWDNITSEICDILCFPYIEDANTEKLKKVRLIPIWLYPMVKDGVHLITKDGKELTVEYDKKNYIRNFELMHFNNEDPNELMFGIIPVDKR